MADFAAVPGNAPIVDGHLDLAENATIFGRDLTRTAHETRALERLHARQATVSIPDLRRGGVAVVLATVTPGFLAKDVAGVAFIPRSAIYETAAEAEVQALLQVALYESWERDGLVRLIKSGTDLESHLRLWRDDGTPGLVMLMEGADPIVRVADLPRWWRRGLRVIGLTFGDTRYGAGVAGGSFPPKPGGLTAEGFAMLDAMGELGFGWDVSHLAEEGLWQGLRRGYPHLCASHANARALTATDRHLTDDAIKAIADRDGVIGLVLSNGFLEPRWRNCRSMEVSVARHFRAHAEHIASVAGWRHVGIGSDLDGGFGLEESPIEIDTVADLRVVGTAVPESARETVMGGNWLRFLRATLPRNS